MVTALALSVALLVASALSVTVISDGYSLEISYSQLASTSIYLNQVVHLSVEPVSVINLDMDESLSYHPSRFSMEYYQKVITSDLTKMKSTFSLTKKQLFELCSTAKVLGSKKMYEALAREMRSLYGWSNVNTKTLYDRVIASGDRHVLPSVLILGALRYSNKLDFGVTELERMFQQAVISNDIDMARAIRYSSEQYNGLYDSLVATKVSASFLDLIDFKAAFGNLGQSVLTRHGYPGLICCTINLEAAVESGDLRTLQVAVKYSQRLPVHILSLCNSRVSMEFLLRGKEKETIDNLLAYHDSNGDSLLRLAVSRGWTGVVQLILDFIQRSNRLHINAADQGLLYESISTKKDAIGRVLLDSHQFDLNYTPQSAPALLGFCIEHRMDRVVKWLVLESVDQSQLSAEELTVMETILYSGSVDPEEFTVTILLQDPDDEGLLGHNTGESPRRSVSSLQYTFPVARLLIDSPYFVSAMNSQLSEATSGSFILNTFPVEVTRIYMELLKDPLYSTSTDFEVFMKMLPVYEYFDSDVLSRFIVRILQSTADFYTNPYPYFVEFIDSSTVVQLFLNALGSFEVRQVFKSAILDGNVQLVEILLDTGLDPSIEITPKGPRDFYVLHSYFDVVTPVDYSVLHQQQDIFEILTNDPRVSFSLTTVHLSLLGNNYRYVERILASPEWYVSLPRKTRTQLLSRAISIGNPEAIRRLIEVEPVGTKCQCGDSGSESPFASAMDAPTVDLLLSIPECMVAHRAQYRPVAALNHVAIYGYDGALKALLRSGIYSETVIHQVCKDAAFELTIPRVLLEFMAFGCKFTDQTVVNILEHYANPEFMDLNSLRILVETGLPLNIPEDKRRRVAQIMKVFDGSYTLPALRR